MDAPAPAPSNTRRSLLAYVGPFALFCLLQALPGFVKPGTTTSATPFWQAAPEFWVYPLQALLCGAMLLFYRREYPRQSGAAGLGFGALIGVVVFVLWIAPQAFLHFAPRTDGFDPTRVLVPGAAAGGTAYAATVALRFARLVLVVPWLEEVFWRGFLLRYLVKEDFRSLPMGAWSWLSFGVVMLGFMFEHTRPDWPAALLTGALYNWVAIRTRSLPACILSHALTNLLLGVYVMQTRQWGFW